MITGRLALGTTPFTAGYKLPSASRYSTRSIAVHDHTKQEQPRSTALRGPAGAPCHRFRLGSMYSCAVGGGRGGHSIGKTSSRLHFCADSYAARSAGRSAVGPAGGACGSVGRLASADGLVKGRSRAKRL